MAKLDKAQEYEARASKWLADANEQSERGNNEKAERLYEKAQKWLDRATIARNWN